MLTAKVGNRTLATYNYGTGNGLLTKQTYSNGNAVSFTYDSLGRTKTATYADGRTQTYIYNGEGRLHSVTEEGGGTVSNTYLFTYDSLGRLISSEQKNGFFSVLRTNQTYNENNQLTKQAWQVGDTAYAEEYTYNASNGSLNTVTTGVGTTLTMAYDCLQRLTSTFGGPVARYYTYRDISDTQTTLQVTSLTSGDYTYDYTYDAMGNIASYTAPGRNKVTYTYDDQGQLLSAAGNGSYSYTYDTVGNILTASKGSTTHRYTYGNTDWKDLLTAFDGELITYDASGNPLSYYNGTRWTFSWNNGRRLSKAVSSGTTVDYAYNLDGLRTGKTVDGVYHNYLYAGGKLMRETYGSNTLDFFYDANGTPYALKYNGTVYYYITNLQGDVTYLVSANGTAVATYEYDPYGNIITATGTLAQINPLRYRGYYYDNETGMYYLQSRYYDPAVGRFINADSYASTGQGIIGYNMFAYCNNSPVWNADFSGERFSSEELISASIILLAIAACAVVATPVLAGIGPVGVIAATATAEIATTAAAATTVAAIVTKKVELRDKSFTIYTLSDPVTLEVVYVGRTSDYTKRMRAHSLNPARWGLDANVLHENLSYSQARALEQLYIVYYGTLDKSNKSKNQINGVNPNRKDYQQIMRNGFGFKEALDSLLTNELLVILE